MRIVIYGAGGIGSVVGGHLWGKGHDVVLIGRPGHIAEIRFCGLKLITPSGTFILTLPAVTSPAQVHFRPDDVVFLCMKGQDSARALSDLRNAVPDVPVFCLQNGVRNEELASRHFSRVYGVMVRIGAEYLKDGQAVCRRDPPGWLIIGRYPRGKDLLCEEVALVLRDGGFLVKAVADVMPYKWGKLLANLGNAADAITGVRGDHVGLVQRAAGLEFRDLLEAAGIAWISQEQTASEWPEINRPPRASLPAAGFSSTWQSLARKQGSVETGFLNGEIVRLAGEMGRTAPVNQMLLRLSQEMAAGREAPGKYTPLQLLKLLGLDSS